MPTEHPSSRRLYRGSDMTRAVAIADLKARFHSRVPAAIVEYVEGGADCEITLHRNRSAYDGLAFVPRVLRHVGSVDAAAALFGKRAMLPLAVAPTGFNGLLWPDGDLALARAASSAGVPFSQSTVSNVLLEDVARVPGLRHWMQLYVFRNMEAVERIVRRCIDADCEALIVTVDTSVFGNRTWDKRSYRLGTDLTLNRKLEALSHAAWMRDWLFRPTPGFANLIEAIPGGKVDVRNAGQWLRANLDPDLDWDKISWLRALWPGKFILKGIMHVEDVILARNIGVDAVVLSNHGGRQLDTTFAPVEVLPEIREAAPDIMLLIDGGIRSGSDIAKAIIQGADGVLTGRSTLYGLGADGEAGAKRSLAILAEELKRTMGLLGCATIEELRASTLVPFEDRAQAIFTGGPRAC
ncbi:MAG: alpha-hydroxy-acid oxidizing enzyme [Ahrensia sp.]|nr:alpha-hydroxy-acid oxidizing enzyme [Ahrensia sp.]